ncbi:bacterial condensin subunit MukB [bacterium A37T11]|nr:bacterial condensin subunit MukB [bacterium A37T11]
MSYPRIYSLSTVGILKHYIHDYLFHPTRTDFVGANGVGKSIIADLLQMIFVYDKDLIKFGTDGVKKEERQINTLPYKTKCAYCFLNIEVNSGKFIITGIQINSQKGKRIIPFVITKQADINLKINELALEKEELIFAKDLLKQKESGEKEIEDIQDLATFLYEKHGLRLNFFSNNETVNTYYKFLYDKNVLPLNLSQDKNLKAFAKVIQSFSKAKTLNLSGNQASRNLKEFLFEESDEDILANFQKEQSELEKILREYESLNKDIQNLSNKQKRLTSLRELEQSYKVKFRSFKEAELQNAYIELKQLEQRESEGKALIRNQETEFAELKTAIENLPAEEEIIKKSYEEADENFNMFNRYQDLSYSIEKLGEEINELKVLILPEVDESWKNGIQRLDISNRNNQDIKRVIALAKPYLEKYKTLENIVTIRKEQSEILGELKSSLKKEKTTKEKLLSLLQKNDENGLLHWYIKNLPKLGDEQLQVVLHYATIPISEITNPDNSSQYINPDELIDGFNANPSKDGFWLKLGALHQFIQFNSDAELLGHRTNLEQSVNQLIQKLNTETSTIDSKLEALASIADAKPYDINLFDYCFDIAIVENGDIEKLRSAVACILQIDEKISQLQSQKKREEEELCTIKNRFKVEYDEPEVIKKELLRVRKEWSDKKDKFYEEKGAKQSKFKSLESKIKDDKQDLQRITGNLTKKQTEFTTFNNAYYQHFQENITDFPLIPRNTEELEQAYNGLWEEYKTAFIGISNLFEETSDEKNPAVQLTIKHQDFSFRVLEEALLGNKIKSTDDITTALDEANQTRTTIANGIRDNMIKIFNKTTERYEKYDNQVKRINAFFIDRKISGRFYFKLEFDGNKEIKIDDIKQMAYEVRNTATKGELQFGQSIIDFIEDFFKKHAKIKNKVPIENLLNPKTYFELSAKLTDQFGTEVPGSTGETYSAIALLGIARLSAVQKEKRKGLRFIILEELGSLDNTNFNTFPAIAEEFQCQIITMAPHTFNIGMSDEWYAHHLIMGKEDDNINYCPSASYFKTKDSNEDLNIYINRIAQ